MRIVLDLQSMQGSNKSRGIGRYTRSLTRAMIRNRGNHEILLVMNGLLLESIESLRSDFDALLPQIKICVWNTPGPVNYCGAGNKSRRLTAELIREAFLADLKPDVVLVFSLFEGLNDDVVTSVGRINSNVPTALIVYDFIPLIYRQPYLENSTVKSWYFKKMEYMRNFDIFFAISESTRQECLQYLGVPGDKVITISAAAAKQFQPRPISDEEEKTIRGRYKLYRPFVMYTGGIDHRKNIESLIQVFAALSEDIRSRYQLAVICAIQPQDRKRLENLAKSYHLPEDQVVFTGFVPDEDLLLLYNLCKVFIFPSWHEGFGLPVLEAMSCGKAVIGSNKSSIPEVIGRQDALFDPMDEQDMLTKLTQVLSDNSFRLELEQHGLQQAKTFSWDKTARTALAAMEKFAQGFHDTSSALTTSVRENKEAKPKLAYISPLPPERSGISFYSEELLPELCRYYEIEVVVAQKSVSSAWVQGNCRIVDIAYFEAHACQYERVLYHFGNSVFHIHMFELLKKIPGVVVLHDFFLSGVFEFMENSGMFPAKWTKELYRSHGYKAVKDRYLTLDTSEIVFKYPCNIDIINRALGLIVHSGYSKKLFEKYYTHSAADDECTVIPLLREPATGVNRFKSRNILEIEHEKFIVCSFGLLGLSKLSHRLLMTWLDSPMALDEQSLLFFVGENDHGEYGKKISDAIEQSGCADRIRVTGWVDDQTFDHFLVAADVAVQLRTNSRGESSAAVLDCMKHALPVIVNANGSMADLPDDVVYKISDEFGTDQLGEALVRLWQDQSLRKQLGSRARNNILKNHAPSLCAKQYYHAIERFYRNISLSPQLLIDKISGVMGGAPEDRDIVVVADALARNKRPRIHQRQLFLDISELVQHDVASGIQRVVRSLLKELLSEPPAGIRIEPVYATLEHGYRYARSFTLRFLYCPSNVLEDDPIEFQPGDIFLGLDLHPQVVQAHRKFYQKMRCYGVTVKFVVYDLLALLMPHNFIHGAEELFRRWFEVVAEADGALCISQSVARELSVWLKDYDKERNQPQRRPFDISWFHLGADIEASHPSKGLPEDADNILKGLQTHLSFLMVGTLEPRKGHALVLDAFEQLWREGEKVNLVVVGNQGWLCEELVKKLINNPALGTDLFWLENVSDEYLRKIYTVSTCLIAASEGEGFGLPLIEAAQHLLPIIARDIPVFREVVGGHAYFFSENCSPCCLAEVIKIWLSLYRENKHPKSDNISKLTWSESVEQLLQGLPL